ncbi:hypothetical protein M885DRAFT_621580 [Pelagophyceae sp. CCMP2097]|nr:hypothetical protein M885DRAFT_621580 [Pelagophyceae sp. CCMP2097]
MQCTKCKSRRYCSKKCQLVDWKEGGHNKACSKLMAAAFQDRLLDARMPEKLKIEALAIAPARDLKAAPWAPGGTAKINLLVKFNSANGDAPDWRSNCAICLDVLPIGGGQQTFYSCCCKRICTECCAKCRQHDQRCPLCRAPTPTSAEELRWLQKHVDKGNAEAQFVLGDAYSSGATGLKQSFKRAVQLYERAAAQGHAPAQNKLGQSYTAGLGVQIDYKTAALWSRRAAEQGYPTGQYNLGQMFYHGKGVAQSYDEAARWWRLAAAQGHAHALFNLGACYGNGKGVPRDLDEALRLYKRAAAKGYAGAAAVVAEHEAYIAATRPRAAVEDWNEGGHKAQCNQLTAAFQDRLLDELMPAKLKIKEEPPISDWRGTCAICLDLLPLGHRTQRFYECCCKTLCTACADKCRQYDTRCPLCRAPPIMSDTEWLRRVQKHVDEGNAEAQAQLGSAYWNGCLGLKQNFKRAVKLYELAAQGYHVAQCYLGLVFSNGKGVAQAMQTRYELGGCSADGCGVAQDYDEALRLYKRAAAKGHAEAAGRVELFEAWLASFGRPT